MGSSPSLRPGRGGGCDIFPSPSSRPFSCDTADSYRGIIPASDRSADDSSTFSSPSLFCICVHTSLLTLIPPLFFSHPLGSQTSICSFGVFSVNTWIHITGVGHQKQCGGLMRPPYCVCVCVCQLHVIRRPSRCTCQ